MIRKALRTLVTLGFLVAGYVGYEVAFPSVARWIGPPRDVVIVPYDPSPSRTEREALELAASAFGANHWAADREARTCYYDAERGFWFFFQNYKRTQGGQQIRFSPFALIWRSRGKTNVNTVVANEAFVDFDKPFDLTHGGDPARIVHAMIEGEVNLRDDKGTTDNGADDLTIGPLTHLEYSEIDHQIRSTSVVELREADLFVRATGLTISLRTTTPPPNAPSNRPPGYTGARTVWLLKDIRVSVQNVGQTGLVPGGSRSDQARPGELSCDGPAQIDLPEPPPKDAPAGDSLPIIAQFYRNVRIRQGNPQQPDQCDADLLRLTLLPSDSTAEPRKDSPEGTATAAITSAPSSDSPPAPAPASPGSITTSAPSFTLKLAEASGHAVWLQSPSQGIKARGNELRYERNAPVSPDIIYFRGDSYTWVEKITLVSEGPEAGQVQTVDTIRTQDITIFQHRDPNQQVQPFEVIARGPGQLETRPGKGLAVQRSASWADRLELENVITKVGPRKRITLVGKPIIKSPTQGTIVAENQIVAYLKESSQTAATDQSISQFNPAGPPSSPKAADSLQIDWVEALGAVHMTAVPPAEPGQPPKAARELLARRKLNVVFTSAGQAAPVANMAPAAPTETEPEPEAPQESQTPSDPPPARPESLAPSAPALSPLAPAAIAVNAPTDPPIRVEADEVWAKVTLPTLQGQPELKEVQLLRDVELHQDPQPGKSRGTDVTGDVLVYVNNGPDQARVEAQGTPQEPARVHFDSFRIEGPRLIVDQATDTARVVGPGSLQQDAMPLNEAIAGGPEVVPTFYQERKDAGPENDPSQSRTQRFGRGPFTIRWQDQMTFYGRPLNVAGKEGNAWAFFQGQVRAITTDPQRSTESYVSCDTLRALLDGPVPFQRVKTTNQDASNSKPRIVLVHCRKEVDLVHLQLRPPARELAQRSQVNAPDVWYNIVSGQFVAEGPGTLKHVKPRGQKSGDAASMNPLLNASSRRPGIAGDAGSATSGTLDLTRVAYRKRVEGRLSATGSSNSSTSTPFQATFTGAVQVLSGGVPDLKTDIAADNPPQDFLFVAADTIDVVRETSSDPAVPEQFFVDAKGGRPMGRDSQKAIFGDRITYDSAKQLVYVYGDSTGVTIASQDAAGQPFSASRGRAVMYNRRDGQIRYIDPQGFLLVDPRTGIRAQPVPPGRPAAQPARRPQPPSIRGPGNDRERKGFTGR